jgi:hypothetical protein
MNGFVDPADEALVATPCGPTPDIAACVAIFRGQVMGPFRTPREAEAALDRKAAELEAQGNPLQHGDDAGSVVFVDPARYHIPKSEGSLNG